MTRRTITRVLLAAIVVSTAGVAAAQQKTDITGAWTFDVKTDAGGGTPTVTFKQDGEKITGHYSSTNLGEADLTGTVKGKDIAFAFDGQVQGQTVPVTYNGTIDSPTTMSGRMSIGGAVGGTFTGKKK
ncbi:MAG TPA: hypothetical protein VFD32_01325 [Dehalococcoidia bacterium]|nr:hypothetical protein [Dehalococcoidia bacterium]